MMFICWMLICCGSPKNTQETQNNYNSTINEGLSLIDSFYITKNTNLLLQAINKFENIDEQHFQKPYHKQTYINYCNALIATTINDKINSDILYKKNAAIIEDYLQKSTNPDDFAVYELFFFKSLSSSRSEFIYYADSLKNSLLSQKIDISIYLETFYPTGNNSQNLSIINYVKIQ